MTYYGSQGVYQLEPNPLASGGEGSVSKLQNHPNMVAKIYHPDKLTSDPELEEKITYMVNNPPDKSVLDQIAWPMDVLRDGSKRFVGFTMPKLDTDTDLLKIYPYPPKKEMPINYEQKVIVALNICIVISEIHKAGYVFGDFNPMNIGVNLTTGHVAFYDTDSYHFTNPKNGHTYRCTVCKDGYVAPELIRHIRDTVAPGARDAYKLAPLPTFTKETDYFALAIHIFKLLMNGYTPFNGIKENETASQASPGTGNVAVERDNYCFKPGNKPQSAAVPELSSLTPDIQYLFKKTFLGGSAHPQERATAEEWYQALVEYKGTLKQCDSNPAHYYYLNNNTCPYCEADKRYQNSLAQATQTFTTGTTGHMQVTFTNPITVPPTQQPVNQPSSQQYQPYQPYQPQTNPYPRTKTKKKSVGRTIGRILLWVFFFPIMLIVTICKSRMPVLLKIFLVGISLYLSGSFLSLIAVLLGALSNSPGLGHKTVEIHVDIPSLTQEMITGHNGFGYFDADITSSGEYETTEKEDDETSTQIYSYTFNYAGRSEDGKYAQFALKIDQGATPVGDIIIRAECNTLLSNGEMLTFEVMEQSAKGHSVVLDNNTMRVAGLTEGTYVTDDPRDQFVLNTTRSVSDGWYKHDWYKFEFLKTEYTVGDKTVRLTLIDDKRPGVEEVHPGFSFGVYGSDGALMFTGSYLFNGMKYDANYDDYGNTQGYWVQLVPQFDQAVMLHKTGILFNNTEKEFTIYH